MKESGECVELNKKEWEVRKIDEIVNRINSLEKEVEELRAENNELKALLGPRVCAICSQIQLKAKFQECNKCSKFSCCGGLEQLEETNTNTNTTYLCKPCQERECPSCNKSVNKSYIYKICMECGVETCTQCPKTCKICKNIFCISCSVCMHEGECMSCAPLHITQDLPLTKLSQFRLIYDESYSHPTTLQELLGLLGKYGEKRLICVGGMKPQGEVVSLCAFGLMGNVMRETGRNRPNKWGEVFWYLTDGQSFGFSPAVKVNQSSADIEDKGDQFRLSWNLQGGGGWRIGAGTGAAANLWRKVIFVKGGD